MRKNLLKTAAALALCCMTAIAAALPCAAAEYTISQIDDMALSLPSDMSAVTRDSQSTDKYFSVFGLDYDTTMKTFKNSDIYLQGMDSSSSLTLTVTMTETESSANVGDYTALTTDELADVRTSFLDTEDYGSCTDLKTDKNIWLVFDVTSSETKSFLANTVYDGMNINITMRRTEGDVTADDAAAFSQIVSSAAFSDLPISKGLVPYVIAGGVLIIIALAVLIIVLAVRIKKHKRKKRNNAIIEELAIKYTGDSADKNTGYNMEAFEEKGEDYGGDEQPEEKLGRRYAPEPIIENLDEPDEITASYRNIDSGSSYAAETYANDSEIDEILDSVHAYKNESSYSAEHFQSSPDAPEEIEITAGDASEGETQPQQDGGMPPEAHEARLQRAVEGPTLVIPAPDYDLFETGEPDDVDLEEDAQILSDENRNGETPAAPAKKKLKIEEKVEGYADIIFGSTDPADESADEVGDEDIVRRELEKNKFDTGYDYFDEAPKKSAGVVMTADLSDFADAEEIDVIDEVEQKAEKAKNSDYDFEVETKSGGRSAGESIIKAGKAVGGALAAFGRGVKSFGIHCGYFCQNVSRMIKRKRKAAKRKKIEQARREREEIRARRRAAASQGETRDGELVQLHRQTNRPSSSGYPAGKNKRK